MKELEKLQREADKVNTEVSVKKQRAPVEYRYDSSLTPMPGHSLWEIDLATMKVRKAEDLERKVIDWFEAVAEHLNPTKVTKEVIKKKGCVYISALNADNALNRYKKGKGSAVVERQDFNF